MTEHTVAVGNITRELVLEVIPSLEFTDPDTYFSLYREYRPTRDTIEYSLFYREPGGEKYRIEGVSTQEDAMNKVTLDASVFRIEYWGLADRYMKYCGRVL
jgi:hypothetical protein